MPDRKQFSAEEIEYLESIRRFATEREKEIIDALTKHGNYYDAAESVGIIYATLHSRISRLKRRAIRRGFSPEHDMTRAAPEGFTVKGVSTLYSADGKVSAQWVKTKQTEQDKLDLLMDAIQPLANDVAGKSRPVAALPDSDEDLLCVYPMGDPHIGMYAWAAETGDRNFDLKLAEGSLLAAVDHLVDLAPPTKTALLINLGDFFHADNFAGVTSRGSNTLDVDGRLPKVLETGVRLMVETIHAALRKHERVIVYTLIGNHDDLMAVVLAVCLKHHFNNNDRVEIETRPRQHHYYEFGTCLFGMHHGHSTKWQQLPPVMAADRPEAWGRTKFRRWYCGHVHHDSVKEFPGCTVETFRTLAPRDAWHSGQGYRSGNDMKLDVWHKRRGHINRHIIGIEAILEEVEK